MRRQPLDPLAHQGRRLDRHAIGGVAGAVVFVSARRLDLDRPQQPSAIGAEDDAVARAGQIFLDDQLRVDVRPVRHGGGQLRRIRDDQRLAVEQLGVDHGRLDDQGIAYGLGGREQALHVAHPPIGRQGDAQGLAQHEHRRLVHAGLDRLGLGHD
ncbi:hypothetical protein D3C71_1343140 [compost metagenome]